MNRQKPLFASQILSQNTIRGVRAFESQNGAKINNFSFDQRSNESKESDTNVGLPKVKFATDDDEEAPYMNEGRLIPPT